MNNSQLRAFHTVAQLGSVTKAAEYLHITQPTVSDHIKALEERYGVKLFDRRGRGVALTSLGHALLDITRRKFSLEAEAEQLLASAHGLASGTLRIAADGPYLVVALLGKFQRQHPNIEISLRFGNSKSVLEKVFSLQADVAILPDVSEDERLHIVPHKNDRLMCIVERGHAFSRRRSIRMEEFSGQRMILREPGSHTRTLIDHAFKQANIHPDNSLVIGSREGVREAVACGLGIGVVSESEVGQDRRIHALSIRGAELKVTEYFVCLKESRPTPVVKALFDLIE